MKLQVLKYFKNTISFDGSIHLTYKIDIRYFVHNIFPRYASVKL